MEDKKFALLIDAENISSRYITGILDELTKYGTITYKRIYSDWTSSQASKWKEELLSNSIMPIQQFSNVSGKNANDSALIIDAMDILYTQNVDGFCIVSSDSDFTRLASRLRESGMVVIGMGEEKTPRSFRAACSIFTSLEILTAKHKKNEEAVSHSVDKKDVSNEISKDEIEDTIVSIITQNENNGKVTALGEIGSRLVNKYPDFDVRNYGYSLLSKFLEEAQGFKLKKVNSTVTVSLRNKEESKELIQKFVKETVQKSGKRGISIAALSNQVYAEYKDLNVKEYGYSKFSKFVQSIDGIELKNMNAFAMMAPAHNK